MAVFGVLRDRRWGVQWKVAMLRPKASNPTSQQDRKSFDFLMKFLARTRHRRSSGAPANPDHASRSAFFTSGTYRARHRSVRLGRCEPTRYATR